MVMVRDRYGRREVQFTISEIASAQLLWDSNAVEVIATNGDNATNKKIRHIAMDD